MNLKEISDQLSLLCIEIEKLPAGDQQTAVSIKAAELRAKVYDAIPKPRQVEDDRDPDQGSNVADTFWGRCGGVGAYWCKDGTCSHCGGARPSAALKLIREGGVLEPTDKNYKIYVPGLPSPGGKCYLNHFSEAQAIELVLLWMQKKINFATPGTFYSGLCFGIYEKAIDAAVAKWRADGEPKD